MKALAQEARTKNVSSRESCRWCADVGYVTVSLRTVKSAWTVERKRPNANGTMPGEGMFEEMGPCPYCEAGFREEFPVPGPKNEKPTLPPWKDGFWQGRDVFEVDPVYPKGFSPLPLKENAKRMRELTATMKTIPKEMPK